MPARATTPTPVMMTLAGIPVTTNPNMTPMRDKITEMRMTNGTLRELNSATMIMKISSSVMTNAFLRNIDAFCCSS